MIRLFRDHFFVRLMSMLTGFLFLNMSFFMIEVNALKLQKNKQLFENIAKLVSGAGQEEEKDIFGAGASESPETNEIDLFLCSALYIHNTLFLIEEIQLGTFYADIPSPESYERVTPPPEV